MTRVLVTGAGGPAGVAVIRSLLNRADVEVFAADMDGWASGLYLVPAERRRLVEPALSDRFVDDLKRTIETDSIDVVFATVDLELPTLAEARTELGAILAAPSLETLRVCLDKWMLAQRCSSLLRVPTTRLLNAEGVSHDWDFPTIVKPRSGAGSRGVRLVSDRAALEAIPFDEALNSQEHLPGDEYSVDVIADSSGGIVAAVPRTRTRVDSGVSIAGRTVHSEELESTAAAVARAIGLVGVANVQLRYATDGTPALLEVNPRFPGAMPLTIAAGVDMPSLALDLALGVQLPARVEFREVANVRYLEDVFLDPAQVLVSAHAAHAEHDE
ncbi:MAG: ATP-grasp domain-containing protein [Rhodoglobus sp.]